MNEKELIARRVGVELKDGDVVNLGIGLPTMVADFVPEGIHVILQSENGMLGMGSAPEEEGADPDICNSGGKAVTAEPGASFFGSDLSFAIIRGGHVDMTVLGGLQVDERGNLASHTIPGKMIPGVGGAMDLLTGSKKVIIAMTHTTKGGGAKIMKKLTLPVTALGKVNLIVTELAVIEVAKGGLVLKEIAEHTTAEEVQKATEARLIISPDLKVGFAVTQ